MHRSAGAAPTSLSAPTRTGDLPPSFPPHLAPLLDARLDFGVREDLVVQDGAVAVSLLVLQP